ncbi:hypothetical protein H5410_017403 [Solanum commersonii]|uniref:Transposase n=1 Tax=Solanum commersonii TaxID=4109 RepID=A0A9J5ZZU8_SOLCO|nr:hypothetical protein H5410_017403 [Solanum commersonii]
MSFCSYYLKCATENCSWVFKSSCLNNSKLFKVRKFYNTHSCPLKDWIQSKRQSTSGVLEAMLVEKYVDLKTVYTPTDIQEDMLRIHALDASIRGWEYCRPIVVMDGTHLKSTYEGTMLIASTLDPGDTYAIPIEPLLCESTWDVPSHVLEEVILPPITRKQPKAGPPKMIAGIHQEGGEEEESNL